MAALKSFLAAALLLWAAPGGAEPIDRWRVPIAEAGARFGIPVAWIRRVMRVESGGETSRNGRPTISPAGAMGLMQLMPGTWRDMRERLGLGPDPFEPRDNIVAGTAYLRLMYDRFGYPGLFAAYNAGPERYVAVLLGRRRLPLETRAYLARIASVRPTKSGAVAASLFAARGKHGGAGPLAPSGASLFVQLASVSGR